MLWLSIRTTRNIGTTRILILGRRILFVGITVLHGHRRRPMHRVHSSCAPSSRHLRRLVLLLHSPVPEYHPADGGDDEETQRDTDTSTNG